MSSNCTVDLMLSKWHLSPVIRSRSLGTSAHCTLVSESPRKTQSSHALGEGRFSDIEKRQSKISSRVCISPPQPAAPSQQPTQSKWPAQTPLTLQNKVHIPFPQGTGIAVGLARCHITLPLQQNEGVHIESEIGRDIPLQGDEKSRTGYECSFSLDKVVFQAQGPFLLSHKEIERLPVCVRLPSQHLEILQKNDLKILQNAIQF